MTQEKWGASRFDEWWYQQAEALYRAAFQAVEAISNHRRLYEGMRGVPAPDTGEVILGGREAA